MGTSVSVAKYMKAPTIEAKKLENKELPPTKPEIHWLGITPAIVFPSCVEPNKKPAVTIPMASSGNICLAKSQVAKVHSLFSASFLSFNVMMLNEIMPTNMGINGASLLFSIKLDANIAETMVARAADNTHCHFILSTFINEYPNRR